MKMNRKAMNSRLWSMVKDLPGGEEAMRDMVAYIRQTDGTGKDLLNTDKYTSTKLLTDQQFMALIRIIKQKIPNKHRARGIMGYSPTYLAKPTERKYISFLAQHLGMSKEGLDQFITRQTKGKGIRTHEEANAVVIPLERMLEESGIKCHKYKGRKWWNVPEVKGDIQCS